MAAKKKVDAAPVYSSWDDVDNALREIREIDAKVGIVELKANALRTQADQLCATVADDLKQKTQLEKNMEAFCTLQLPNMEAKSRKLNHGTIQFNASKECVVKSGFTIKAATEVMLTPLKAAYDKLVTKAAGRFLRFKCEIDKAGALAAFNAKQTDNTKLAALGLEVVDKNNFGYTLADSEAKSTA